MEVELVKIWSGQASSKKGNNIKRKDLQEMLEYCKIHKDVKYLIVDEPDRFMRSFEEAGHYVIEFRKLGVEIIFSDDSLNGDGSSAVMTRALKLALAEFDNLARINKAIKGHEVALREGRYTFQPPIGYMRDNTTKAGVHKINPETGPVLQQALIAISDSRLTIKDAMIWYNENCPPIRDGKHTKMRMDKWTKYIANPYYAGIVEMDKQIKARNEKGLHEPLITMEQHEKILQALDNKRKLHKGPTKGGNKRFPLNQILLCEDCASKGNKFFKFTGYDNKNGKTDKIYSRYFCRGCNKALTRDEAHRQVENLFGRLDFTDTGRKAVAKALNSVWNKEEQSLKMQLSLYKQDLTELKEKKQKLLDQIVETNDQNLKEDLNNYLEKTRDNILKLGVKIEAAEKNLASGRNDFLDFALEYIDNMGKHFFELPLEEVGVCKNILFPSGFWVDSGKTVYTPEISPLYRERTTKMGALNPEKCHVVGDEGLEPPTFSV
ncbi:recombinase family protein [Candidatus Saccharibacteria bacterium]|nr:recombinase family protein [Candidatus Saccharibacteria bacterium]